MLHATRFVVKPHPSRLAPRALRAAAVAVVAVAVLAAALPAAAQTTCAASASWVSDPDPPQEIPGGGTDFCQFYQFAWQWFLYLGSPSEASADLRNFEDEQAFPLLQASGTDSCTAEATGSRLFVRTFKADDSTEQLVVPERINQAGDGATIYDQSGNVVYYEVSFSRNLCDAATTGDLPAGTTELKTSWRVLPPGSEAGYFTQQAVITGVSEQPVTLGLVGFHLFRTTAQHPEGVWATWEHASNVPDCLSPQAAPAAGWSFTSTQCAQCLATSSTGPLGCASCDFNVAPDTSSLTGTPSEVCRVYPDGSGPDDNKAAENVADVDTLNQQLAAILGALPSTDPMAVWASYFNVGGLWVSDPSQPASSSNQRGSLQLANTTMETTFQGDFKETGSAPVRTGALNCFGCHDYTPGQTATSGLSHIFDDIHGSSAAAPAAAAGVAPLASHGRPALLSSH